MKQIVVVGGGAAGMMAAIQCAGRGCAVILLEQNEKLGKKLFITGKGRCNLTNSCDVSELFSHVISNSKFLYSAFYTFSNEDTITFFEDLGLKTKVERGNRVFPCSDHSSDVIRVLTKECRRHQVDIRLNTKVKRLLVEENKVRGVEVEKGGKIPADKVILATGGISYPGTGANDSGLKMASQCGHSMTKLRPGLTGMIVKEEIPGKLQGLTLKNCAVWISGKDKPKKKLFDGLGELLFTHYGVSGPLILSASSRIGDRLAKEPLFLHVDLKPGLTEEQLDRRILKDFEAAPNLDIKNALIHLLPKSMIPVMLDLCRIPTDKKVNEISKEERIAFRRCLKDMTLTLEGLRDIAEAIITRGGIKVNEVDPSTMESKVISDLYFAGEMMDLDALTGGFNLQIAWSTGYLAGISASEG